MCMLCIYLLVCVWVCMCALKEDQFPPSTMWDLAIKLIRLGHLASSDTWNFKRELLEY